MTFKNVFFCIALGAALAGTAQAQTAPAADAAASAPAAVQVEGAWVRAAVAGQSGTGAFMKLTAPTALRLVGVESPVAGVAEVHEMKLEGDMMRMRAMPDGLELPAGRTVELKPGGYHLMLMDLRQPLASGATVPLTLRLVDAHGGASTLALQVPVMAGPAPAHRHMH